MLKKLLEVIKEEEGSKMQDGKHIPYRCSENKLTICYGLLIDPDVPGAGITEAQAMMLLETTVNQFLVELRNNLPWYGDQPEDIQVAIANMAYQLGVPKLLTFKKTLDHIENGRYSMASAECKNSKWFQQTPNRCQRVSDVFKKAAEV